MDHIFEHEKLWVDELMKKVSAKNNFTPLKPLKKSSPRKNSINDEKYKEKYTQRFSKVFKQSELRFRSFSPGTPSLLDLPFYNNKRKTLLLEKFNIKSPDITLNLLGRGSKILETEESKHFPIISKSPYIRKNKIYAMKKEKFRKYSKSLIAYVPTVSFINDNEDLNKKKLTIGKKMKQTMIFKL